MSRIYAPTAASGLAGGGAHMTDTDSTDRLLTQREYAHYRRCSIRTIERERAVGIGCPYVRLGARILYRLADIDRFVDAHLIGRPAFAERDQIATDRGPRSSTASVLR